MNRMIIRSAPRLGKKRVALIILVFIILIVLTGIFMPQKTDIQSENNAQINIANIYRNKFLHQPKFFSEQKDGTLTLLWDKRSVTITTEPVTLKQYAAVYPTTLKDKRIKYEISDTDIAQVSEDGTITAKKPGVVTLKATLLSSGYSCEAQLTIKRGIDSIFMPTTNVVMNKSDSYRQLSVDIFPENATDTTINWRSKNTQVAIVDSNGTLKPVGKGMTEIVATTPDGKHSAKCFVQVIDEAIKPDSIEILNKQSAYLDEGQSMNMVATIAPYNSKDKSISWASSDTAVATISQSGRIKAIQSGTCEIIAKTSNGKSDTVLLTVNKSGTKNSLDLSDRQTSANEIPRDILGNSYVHHTTTMADGQITYISYPTSLSSAVSTQMSLSTPRVLWSDVNNYSVATEDEIREYINPQNYHYSSYKYQFLDLSRTNGISAQELDRYLSDKGVLKGMGQAFIDAANEYNISEIYLVVHACLETGNGSSTLARGVNVNGSTVYNVFGIAAYDSGAVSGGSQMAYRQGWTTIEAAINGGAKWISENYLNNSYGQNTLYDMLWNPANPGVHQYATDISWAIKQTANIAKFADRFPYASLSFEIPVYEGETAISLN